MKNKIAREYIKEVKRNLPYFMARKKQFLKDFRENLNAFSEEKPDAAREDYVERFGIPEEIAISFLPEVESIADLKKLKRKKLVVRLMIGFFAVVLVVLVALTASYVWKNYNFFHGHYEEFIGEGHSPEDTSALAVY